MRCAIACAARGMRSDAFAAKKLRKKVNIKPPGDGPRLSCIAKVRRILESLARSLRINVSNRKVQPAAPICLRNQQSYQDDREQSAGAEAPERPIRAEFLLHQRK